MPTGSSGRPASPRRCRSRRCWGRTSRSPRPTSSPGRIRARSSVAAELRHLLRDSGLQRVHHGSTHKVQDPYSLRCVPQVHGAVRDALDHLRRVLDIELNSATDNPLVFPGGGVADADTIATGGGRVISGGNFHGEPIALALDFAKLALGRARVDQRASDGAARRPRLNGGLPPFLARVIGRGVRDDDLPVHRRRPRVASTRCWPTRLPRTRSRRRRTRRTTCRWARSRRATPGPSSTTSSGSSRSSCWSPPRRSTCGWRACGRWRRRGHAAPGAGVAEAHRRIRERVAHLDRDREPGPDLAAATATRA